MGENNEYYAEKMRRLIESQKKSGTDIRLESAISKKQREDNDTAPQNDFTFPKKRGSAPYNRQRSSDMQKEISGQDKQDYDIVPRKRIKDRIVTAVLSVAIVIIAVFCVYKLLFVIKNINVTGCSAYTEEQVIAASEIKKGDNLYSFSSRIAGDNIKMYCPAVSNVKVKRTPLGNISLTIEEQKPVFWVDIYGEARGLTADLRVLAIVTDEEKQTLKKIKLPAVKNAIAGEIIELRDDGSGYVFEVAKAVCESKLLDRIGSVDLRSSYNVRITCDGKYILKLGEYKDSSVKLKIAVSVLEDEMFNTENKASLDLTDVSQTGVIVDNQLQID